MGWPLVVAVILTQSCGRQADRAIPAALEGTFVDDYGTRHTIDDSLWVHGTGNRYHAVEWHAESRVLLARNDSTNAADGGRFDRIDWVTLPGDEGWTWAFCITTWDAATLADARSTTVADTAHPRSGCGGYPFTRMRRVTR